MHLILLAMLRLYFDPAMLGLAGAKPTPPLIAKLLSRAVCCPVGTYTRRLTVPAAWQRERL